MRVREVWIGLALVWLAAARAEAFPIVFDGPGGYGISASSAASAEAAGVPIIDVTQIFPAASLHLTIPAPEVLSSTIVSHPSVSNPNLATSRWSVTDSGPALSDAWLVFLNPTANAPYDYTPAKVGFEIDGGQGWALFSVIVTSGKDQTEYFYPAKFLGDMDAAETVQFLMHHRVGEALHQSGSTLYLPQYSVGALQGVPPVPEPAALVLGALALLAAAAVRRRS